MTDKKVRVVLELEGKQYSSELQLAGRDTQAFAQGVVSSTRSAVGSIGELNRGVNDLGGNTGKLTQGFGGLAAGTLGVAGAVGVVTAAVTKLVGVQREFDVLNSSLITVTGSSTAAQREFEWIKSFAATTPFALNEVTGAFVKMKALGLDASQQALTSYGNTASAMGKSLDQMVEAVADAATGEFERLKEFGIKANQEGDRVTLTFKGVATNIGNNAEEITQYLTQLGNVDFAGAMETRAATLDGAISNLADSWNGLVLSISQTGMGNAMGTETRAMANELGLVTQAIEETRQAGGGMVEQLGNGIGMLVGRSAFGALNMAVNSTNWAVNTLSGGMLDFATNVDLTHHSLKSASAQSARLSGELQQAQAKLGELQRQSELTPDSIYLKSEIHQLKLYIQELRAAQQEKAKLAGGGGAIIGNVANPDRLLAEATAKANAKLSASYDDLRMRLSGFKGDFAQYQKDLAEIQRLRAAGTISEKQSVELLTTLAKAHGEVGKAAKTAKAETFVAGQDAAKAWADVLTSFDRIGASAQKEALGLDAADTALKAYLESAQYVADVEAGRQNEVINAYLRAKGHIAEADALTRTTTAHTALVQAEQARIDAATSSATTAEQRLQSLRDEEAAIALSASGHMTLAQAIEQVAITRLREQQAALMREGDRDSEVLAIQREIDARKKLVDALGGKGVREAAEKSAKATADAFERRTEQIEQGLTDAVMRGGQSGKEYLEGLFRTTAFRVVLDPVMKPISGVISSAVNTVMGGTGTSALGTAANAASLYNAGSALYGMGGVASSAGIISGATYGTAAGSAQSIMLAGQEIGGSIGSAMIAGAESASSVLSVAFDPITLGIGALIAVLASMDDSGTPHIGGSAIADSVTGIKEVESALIGFSLSASDVSDKVVDSSKQLAGSALSILEGLEKLSGGSGKFSVATGFARDSSKDPEWGALSITRDGQSLVDWRDTQTNRWAPKEFANGEEGAKQYGNALAAGIKQAIDQIDLPDWAAKIVAQMGDSPTMDDLSATLAKIQAMPGQALQAIGTSSQALGQIIYTGMQAGDPAGAGAAFAGQITYGIESSLYSGFSQQITGIISTQLVTPIVTAMASGATITEAMATASVDAMKAQVAAAGTAFASIVNDPGFKDALASVQTLIADTVGSSVEGLTAPVAPAAYSGQVATVAPAATTAISNLSNAVDQLRQKAESAVDSLNSTGADLAVQLLRAQGDEESALKTERENFLAQYADLTVAEQSRIAQLYDSNQAIREQISALEKADAVSSQKASLERQLLEIQGDTVALRALELAEIDPSNRAMLGRIHQLQDEKTAAENAAAAAEKLRAAIDSMYSAADSTASRYLDGEDLNRYRLARIAEQANAAVGGGIVTAQSLDGLGIAQIQEVVLDFVRSDAAAGAKASILQLGASLIELKQSALDSASAVADAAAQKTLGLQLEIARLSGDTTAIRAHELSLVEGDLNQALQRHIWLLQDQATAAQAVAAVSTERTSLENKLLQLQGNTVALRSRELDALDPSNRALQQLIYSIEDLGTAGQTASTQTDGVLSALEKQMSRDRKTLEASRAASASLVEDVKGLFDSLGNAVDGLFARVNSGQWQAAQGREYISSALMMAGSTGALPDSKDLSRAISAATAGLESTRYSSKADADFDRLKLANELQDLQSISGSQLTQAEHMLSVAESQLTALDDQLAAYRQQVDEMRGVKQYAGTTAQLIAQLLVSIADERGVRSAVNTESVVSSVNTPSVYSVALPQFANGGDHSGGLRVVGERGWELEATGAARIWNQGQLKQALQGGSRSDELAEMRATNSALRALLADSRSQQLAVVTELRELRRLHKSWNSNGMPGTRDDGTTSSAIEVLVA